MIHARQAVASDPIDPKSPALLGASLLLQGRDGQAERAFRVAGQMGWREPLTQLYWMNVALAQGQPNVAAMRLDAVLRVYPALPNRDALLAQFEQPGPLQSALVARLAGRPPWAVSYANDVEGVSDAALSARAEVVSSLPQPWGCEAVARGVSGRYQRGLVIPAARIWHRHCPTSAIGSVADSDFRHLSAAGHPVPFEWNLFGDGDVFAQPSGNGTGGMTVQVAGAMAKPVVWQAVVLAPGHYRLNWTVTAADGSAANAVKVALACQVDSREFLPAQLVDPRRGIFSAEASAERDCPAHFVTVWAQPAPRKVTVQSVTLHPG